MIKPTILSLVSAAVVCGAFAQVATPAKPAASAKKAKPVTSIACAVMPSNKVDIAAATKSHMYADYKGNRYFFCCGGCPGAFKATPAKYAKAAHIPTPKATKA